MESEKESNFSLTREMRRQRLRMTKNPQLIIFLKKKGKTIFMETLLQFSRIYRSFINFKIM